MCIIVFMHYCILCSCKNLLILFFFCLQVFTLRYYITRYRLVLIRAAEPAGDQILISHVSGMMQKVIT